MAKLQTPCAAVFLIILCGVHGATSSGQEAAFPVDRQGRSIASSMPFEETMSGAGYSGVPVSGGMAQLQHGGTASHQSPGFLMSVSPYQRIRTESSPGSVGFAATGGYPYASLPDVSSGVAGGYAHDSISGVPSNFASQPYPSSNVIQTLPAQHYQEQYPYQVQASQPSFQIMPAAQQSVALPYVEPQMYSMPQQSVALPYVAPQSQMYSMPQQSVALPYVEPQMYSMPQQSVALPYVAPQSQMYSMPQQSVEVANVAPQMYSMPQQSYQIAAPQQMPVVSTQQVMPAVAMAPQQAMMVQTAAVVASPAMAMAYPPGQVAYAATPQSVAVMSAPQQVARSTPGRVVYKYFLRFVPGISQRELMCRQKVECHWNTVRKPGTWVYYRKMIVLPGIVYPPIPPVYPPIPPVYPPTVPVCPRPLNCGATCSYNPLTRRNPTCFSNNCCRRGQMCCYHGYSRDMRCIRPTVMYKRHQTLTPETITSSRSLTMSIGSWQHPELTSLITAFIIPIKVELQEKLNITLLVDTPMQRNEKVCDSMDIDCVGSKLLSCITEIEDWNANLNITNIPQNFDINGQPYVMVDEVSEDSNHNIEMRDTIDIRGHDEPVQLLEFEQEHLTMEELNHIVNQVIQVRILSFVGCLLQSFQAGVVELKGSALLAAKRCARSYRYDWQQVRRCAASNFVERSDPANINSDSSSIQHEPQVQDSGAYSAVTIVFNGQELITPLLDMKLSLCNSLNDSGAHPVLCDLVYGELVDSEVYPEAYGEMQLGGDEQNYDDAVANQTSSRSANTESESFKPLENDWNENSFVEDQPTYNHVETDQKTFKVFRELQSSNAD